MLEFQSVNKRYGTLQALKDVELRIERGSCFGLLGPNGAGKSTLIKIVAGVLRTFDGEVRVGGKSVAKARMDVKRMIGYVPQDIVLEESLSARDNLRLFGQWYGLSGQKLNERVKAVLEQIGLSDRGKENVSGFSGGMKRRLNIGCALLHEPAVLVLDEPAVGIDPQSRNSILEMIRSLRAKGCTIVYSSHYMEEVEQLCDSVGFIDKGRIIASGPMKEVLGHYRQASILIAGEGVDQELLAGFGKVEANGDGYLLGSEDALTTLGLLTAELQSKQLYPERLELHRPRLEDIFFELTGKQLRDG